MGSQRLQLARRSSVRPATAAVKVTASTPLLALDVEFTHWRDGSGEVEQSGAAWVALVDRDGGLVLDTLCRPLELPPDIKHVVWQGGVDLSAAAAAPSVADIAKLVLQAVAEQPNTMLIGHGLRKDLTALGLDPAQLNFYDLMVFPDFQGKGGTAYSLRRLANTFLQQNIHRPGKRHSAVQDARVAMELYTRVVLPARVTDYTDLVDWHTQQLLAQWQQRQCEDSEH